MSDRSASRAHASGIAVRPFARRAANGMVMVEPRRVGLGMALFTLRAADEVRHPSSALTMRIDVHDYYVARN
jgi:hypothetical protein